MYFSISMSIKLPTHHWWPQVFLVEPKKQQVEAARPNEQNFFYLALPSLVMKPQQGLYSIALLQRHDGQRGHVQTRSTYPLKVKNYRCRYYYHLNNQKPSPSQPLSYNRAPFQHQTTSRKCQITIWQLQDSQAHVNHKNGKPRTSPEPPPIPSSHKMNSSKLDAPQNEH